MMARTPEVITADQDQRAAAALNETKNSALIEALESADWSGVNLGTKALIQSAINALAGTNGAQAGPVIELSRVEQMAAYYEAPQAFFEWLDLMRSAQDEGLRRHSAD